MKRLAAILGCTALLWGVNAFADTKTIQDAKGDAGQSVDIKSATATHGAGGRLKHIVTAYGTFKTGHAPCLHIKTTRHPGDDFLICGDGKVLHISKGGQNGTAKVKRPTEKRVVYLFYPRQLGHPNSYKWKVWDEDDIDSLPNTGYVKHAL